MDKTDNKPCFLLAYSTKEGTVRVRLDKEDLITYSRYKWTVSSLHHVYKSYRKGKKTKKHYLARLIMFAQEDQTIKYLNGNPLDLRKANLVLLEANTDIGLTPSLKPASTLKLEPNLPTIAYRVESRRSKYIGVVPSSFISGHWKYRLVVNNTRAYGGIEDKVSTQTWECEREAAMAYDRAVLHHFGNCEHTRSKYVFNFPHLLPPLPGDDIDEF